LLASAITISAAVMRAFFNISLFLNSLLLR
jgi:hypothetical protein